MCHPMSCLRVAQNLCSRRFCNPLGINVYSSFQTDLFPTLLCDTFGTVTSRGSFLFGHFIVFRASTLCTIDCGPAESPAAVVDKNVSAIVTQELCQEMKHKKKKSHKKEKHQKRLHKLAETANVKDKQGRNKNKLKYFAMASGFQGPTSFSASKSDAEENGDIVIVYDKLEEEKKAQETVRKQSAKMFNLAEQFDIKLEDIPLPPENWCFKGHQISLENIPLPPSPSSFGKKTSKSLNESEEFSLEVEDMNKLFKKFRKWESIDSGRRLKDLAGSSKDPSQEGNSFTILSYNVLAQQLLEDHHYLYRSHDSRALSWDYRSSVLLKEIKEAGADILCLQEVQASHINSFYTQLEDLGYKGLFKQRTNGKVDGCALYYKTDKFKLIESTTVEYYQPHMSALDRDNIAIIARLELQESVSVGNRNQIVVATTHLLYNPRRHDIKLAQTQVLLAELDRVSYIGCDQMTGKPRYLPIILTGDFNLEPNSAVYQFLVEGFLRFSELTYRSLKVPLSNEYRQETVLPPRLQISSSSQHLGLVQYRSMKSNKSAERPDGEKNFIQLYNSDVYKSISQFWNKMSQAPPLYEECYPNGVSWSGKGYIHHHLNLQSVYKHIVQGSKRKTHEATTHQDDWVTVDYIFYSGTWNEIAQQVEEGRLKLMSRYTLPTCGQCQEFKKLPNLVCGSDHLSLMAQFLLIPDSK